MMAAMIPAGMPSGSTILRPIVSANNNNQPPIKMARGRYNWFLGPTKALAICGAIRPINAIPPVTETAEAAKATAVSKRTMRSFSIETPMPIATGSLNPNKFSRFALYNVKGIRMANQGRIAQIKGQSAHQIFPANHFAIKSTFDCSADEIKTIIKPERAIEKPIPTSTNLTGSRPVLRLYEKA